MRGRCASARLRFFIRGDGALRSEALRDLTSYDYFKTTERSGDAAEKARLFRTELDLAFFVARLGWSVDDYYATTPVQRAFIRKEIETLTVQQSELVKNAVTVAVNNVLNKKKRKLWVRLAKSGGRPPIALLEMDAIQEQMNRSVPWTPWNGQEV